MDIPDGLSAPGSVRGAFRRVLEVAEIWHGPVPPKFSEDGRCTKETHELLDAYADLFAAAVEEVYFEGGHLDDGQPPADRDAAMKAHLALLLHLLCERIAATKAGTRVTAYFPMIERHLEELDSFAQLIRLLLLETEAGPA